MAKITEILVVGGGFAGVSAAYQLASLNNGGEGLKFPDFPVGAWQAPISALRNQSELVPLDKVTEASQVRVTLVEKEPTLGGRIWSPVDKRNGESKVIEMGGEFIDGNFLNTLYYCSLLGLEVSTVPGWSTSEASNEIQFADSYRVNLHTIKAADELPEETKAMLVAIEHQIEKYSNTFIEKGCGKVVDTKPSNYIYVDGDKLPAGQTANFTDLTFFGLNDCVLNYQGTQATKLKQEGAISKMLKLEETTKWAGLAGDEDIFKDWTKISVLSWLNEKFAANNSSDQQLGKAIWLNSIAGEYGDPAQVGLAFIIHQAAVYNFVKIGGLEAEQSLGLRESMRVVKGNDAIAKTLGEKLLAAGHVVTTGQCVDRLIIDGTVNATLAGETTKFDHVVVTTPVQEYSRLFEAKWANTNINGLDQINYGVHAKVSVSKQSSLQGLVQVPIDGSYWDSTDFQVDNPSFTASQVWIEYPFLGDSTQMQANDWMTFYLTWRAKPNTTEKNQTIQACVQWANNNVFNVGQYTSAGVGEVGSIEAQFRPNRYHTGYAAYGPGGKNDQEYLSKWQALINANISGIDETKVILAGEHTDDYYVGYMEGALRTGAKAAQAIARKLKGG